MIEVSCCDSKVVPLGCEIQSQIQIIKKRLHLKGSFIVKCMELKRALKAPLFQNPAQGNNPRSVF